MRTFKCFNLSSIFPLLLFLFIGSCSEPVSENKEGEKINNNILEPISYLDVVLTDNFWKPKIEINSVNGLKTVFEEAALSINNFDIVASKKKGEHVSGKYDDNNKIGYVTGVASDSDVYKILQAAAHSLHHNRDSTLEQFTDSVIDRIVAAQQADGYLFTYWMINDPEMRWTDIERKHELYCAGHMFEAAAEYYLVTGKRKLLNAAIKLADHIDSIFGPGKRIEVPGHQEIELALYKLYKVTEEERYLNLSKFFIGERGNPERIADQINPPEHDPNAGKPSRWRHPSYRQDHLPVEEQYYAIGHAVRAAYLYSAMADIAMETKSFKYVNALNSIWNDIAQKKLYVTGAIGTRQFHDEGFGTSYLLPSDQAYCETCSGIALTFWNRRMNLLYGDTKYADMLELTMYNAGISGVSLEGDRFFYSNPLESVGKNKRKPWFNPACCPSNMVRFLPEIGGTIYAKKENEIFVNQFIASKTKIKLKDVEVPLIQIANYPWEGEIKIIVEPESSKKFKLNIRIPGWAKSKLLPGDLYSYLDKDKEAGKDVIIKINGKKINNPELIKGYVVIDRKWKKGDFVELILPMDVKYITGNPKIEDTHNKVVLSRGPLVYCLEEIDNAEYFDDNNESIILPEEFKAEFNKNLLGGVVTLNGSASVQSAGDKIDINAIPYYAWCNRGQGQMKVWLQHK